MHHLDLFKQCTMCVPVKRHTFSISYKTHIQLLLFLQSECACVFGLTGTTQPKVGYLQPASETDRKNVCK